MRRKRFMCGIVAAMMVLTTACSSGTKTENPEQQAADTKAQTEEKDTSQTEGESQTGERQKVVWWSWQPSDKVMEELLPAFEKAHPEIELEYWRGELPDYQKKLQVAIASGEGPDIMGVQVGAMLNQYAKFLEPMEPAAEEIMGSDWENIFLEDALNECKSEDGVQVALPATVSGVQFIMYNKTLFDEAGIEGVPATYEEWKEDIETLRAAKPDVIPVVFGAKGTDVCVDMFNALSQQFGPGKIYEAEAGKIPWTDPVFVDTMKAWKQMFDDKIFQDGAIGLQMYPDASINYFFEAGKIPWTDPVFVDTMKAWKQMFDDKIFQDGAIGLQMYPDASINYFFDRKAAMFMTGTWQTGSLVGNGPKANGAVKDDEFGMFILPQIGPNESKAVASTDWAVGINKDSKNKEAAKVVIDFMLNGEGMQIVANQLGASSANKNIVPSNLEELTSQTEREAVQYGMKAVEQSGGKRLLSNKELVNALGVAMQDPSNLEELTSQTEREAVQYGMKAVEQSGGKRLLSNKELVNALGVAMQDVVTGKDIEKALQEVQDTYEKLK